ncbi:response regulator transcription factor [Erwiniaceae bacterium BAC15a-03b]|uniref:DNA-binding dual transcriptional regulator OmpR n=1 Tax=Winslowiella arboricola TaxID=2978220 RepID=A0A9J6PU23_9GAMM|nr:response regulator transcription factor [Winslowiella arboricola]MCU5772518.1 response regulator transcription factor [Winslowiella arboricola]MCU5779040.1 response regulator transcription factor [Winslowiella arboricola]
MVTTPRVLVVDDHRKIREPLAVYLRRQGFDVRTAENAAAMWLLLKQLSFEMVILDVMLPDGDGMVLCQQLQRRNNIPVILLTARDATDDRVRGLDLGADDYVVKPFEPRELVSRINSVLRRSGTVAADAQAERCGGLLAYRFAGLHFLPASGLLSGEDGAGIALSTMEGRLLAAFLQHPNRVLSRDRLIDLCVSPGNDIFDRAIDRQVSRLRSKLAHFLRDSEVLITVWGSGYRLAADVSELQA